MSPIVDRKRTLSVRTISPPSSHLSRSSTLSDVVSSEYFTASSVNMQIDEIEIPADIQSQDKTKWDAVDNDARFLFLAGVGIFGGDGDVLGNPDLPPSFQGCRYFVLITDDVTRYRWIFFIEKKSHIYGVIVFFLNHLLNQEITCAFLRSDWAPEIDEAEFQKFLSEKGVKWEPSAAYQFYNQKE